jgi:DNA-directed RNA polymerase sigma subunit (sigma70/sigma32)
MNRRDALLPSSSERRAISLAEQQRAREESVAPQLDRSRPHTHREIADAMGISQQRVAQIEQRALQKIRAALLGSEPAYITDLFECGEKR